MSTTPWGVDLSPTYNPTVDAQAIKDAGASYAILKVSEGVGWPALGTPEFDWLPRVAADIQRVGLQLRTYHLATPSTAEDAQAEAAWYDKHAGLIGVGASIAYDLETVPDSPGRAGSFACYRIWATTVRDWHPEALTELYCNRDVLGQLEPFMVPSTPLWIAIPGWSPGMGLPWPNVITRIQIGQRTFPGTAGDVDVNIDRHATLGDLAEAVGKTKPTPKPPAPPAPPTDWSIPVRNIDLRNADKTPITGASIESLQTLLVLALGPIIKVDGIGGPATKAALLTFQERKGIATDPLGVAGQATWGVLCSK
ncbi:MAG TPA: peptidoglycan-binding protein [Acidothermaceae bacterium]|jgi:hypothetical protein